MVNMKIECPDCKSNNFFIKEKGTMTGLYCSDCGRWIKWLNKKELRLIQNNDNEDIVSKNNTTKEDINSIQCAACGFLGEQSEWFNTNIIGGYMCCPNCGTVRYVCKENIRFRK